MNNIKEILQTTIEFHKFVIKRIEEIATARNHQGGYSLLPIDEPNAFTENGVEYCIYTRQNDDYEIHNVTLDELEMSDGIWKLHLIAIKKKKDEELHAIESEKQNRKKDFQMKEYLRLKNELGL